MNRGSDARPDRTQAASTCEDSVRALLAPPSVDVLEGGSLVSRLNMFTLIALGTGTAWLWRVWRPVVPDNATMRPRKAGGQAVGASASLLTFAAVAGEVSVPIDRWWQLLIYGGATASAFAFMFAALRRLGSQRTSVLLTLEDNTEIPTTAQVLASAIAEGIVTRA